MNFVQKTHELDWQQRWQNDAVANVDLLWDDVNKLGHAQINGVPETHEL